MVTDEEIQILLDKSPQQGLEMLLNLYGGTVKTICKNLLSGFSDEDIEEAVADCFIAFWKSRGGLVNAVSVKGYLIGITKNVIYGKMKSMLKRTPSVPLDELEIGIDVDMTDEAARQINIKIIQEVIASIPSFEREIFIRRYYKCERVRSISETMACSENKIRNTLYRYKSELKSRLTEGGIIL